MKHERISHLNHRKTMYGFKNGVKLSFLGSLMLLLISANAFAQGGDMSFKWGYGFGGKDKGAVYGDNSDTYAKSAVSDNNGNTFMAGEFSGELHIGNITLTSSKGGG